MTKMPSEIRKFYLFFIIFIAYQLISMMGVHFLKLSSKNVIATMAFVGGVLYIIFLVHFYYSLKLLRLNSFLKIHPWIIITFQIFSVSRLVIPEMVIPIFIWIKTIKLSKLDIIKTSDATNEAQIS